MCTNILNNSTCYVLSLSKIFLLFEFPGIIIFSKNEYDYIFHLQIFIRFFRKNKGYLY